MGGGFEHSRDPNTKGDLDRRGEGWSKFLKINKRGGGQSKGGLNFEFRKVCY